LPALAGIFTERIDLPEAGRQLQTLGNLSPAEFERRAAVS